MLRAAEPVTRAPKGHLSSRPRAPAAGPPRSAGAGVATFLLLAVGGVALLALAAALAAAAFSRSFSPLAHLGLPATHGGRAWLLVGAMAVLALLVWLVVRAGEETLWLPAGRGGVLVPAATLQGFAEAVACRHAEVVRAEARLHARGGVLRGTLQLFCRPLADAGRVRRRRRGPRARSAHRRHRRPAGHARRATARARRAPSQEAPLVTPFARAGAVAAGLVALLVAAAAFVREVVLAAQPSVAWSAAHWWSGLAGGPAWRPGLAAGGLCGARRGAPPTGRAPGAAAALARPGRAGREGRPRSDGRGGARTGAAPPAAGRSAGVTAHKVLLRPAGERWWARVEADLPLRDLLGVQRRAVDIVTADLRRVGGLELEGVDIVVTGVVPAGGAPAQKKTRE